MIPLFPFLLYNGGDPGPASLGRIAPSNIGSIVDVRRKPKDVGMQVVRMNDGNGFLPGKKIAGKK
jgi:hypothetical protein